MIATAANNACRKFDREWVPTVIKRPSLACQYSVRDFNVSEAVPRNASRLPHHAGPIDSHEREPLQAEDYALRVSHGPQGVHGEANRCRLACVRVYYPHVSA